MPNYGQASRGGVSMLLSPVLRAADAKLPEGMVVASEATHRTGMVVVVAA